MRFDVRFFSLLSLSLAVGACAPSQDVADDSLEALEAGQTARHPLDGTPQGLGVLALLNHRNTTLTTIDVAARLESRAANGIIAHRDGRDARFGTADDDLYGSIDEVDAVPYVGQTALDQLVGYASANGWVATGGDVIGSWDGVSFTADEAAATVAFANTASQATLDDELGLDSRAVGAIVAARPIASVAALSQLYYVGGSALTTLKEAAKDAAPAPAYDCSEAGAYVRGTRYFLLPDAVAAAAAGDTIELCDGGYGDPIIVQRDLTIRGINGADHVTLDVTGMGASAIEVRGVNFTLEGVTVMYGEGTQVGTKRLGGGLYAVTSKTITVKRSAFTENYATEGGAIRVAGTGQLVVSDTDFRHNHAQTEGGGIWTGVRATVIGGTFEANEAAVDPDIHVDDAGSLDRR